MGLTLSTDKQHMGADREHIRYQRLHSVTPSQAPACNQADVHIFCTCLVAVISFKEIAWTSACALILYVKDKLEPLSSFLFKESLPFFHSGF